MKRFIAELKRRNVVRTVAAYLVVAWLLVQVGDVLLDTFAAPAWAMQALVIVLAIGLVVAFVMAWLYEFTAEGVRADADTDGHAVPKFTARQVDRGIIVVLVVALSFFAAERFLRNDPTTTQVGPQSIAVLPFAFLGPEADSEYFADAITEELIGRLGRIASLRVKSRLSVARFRNLDEHDAARVADDLGVDLLLEGSVRKSGERVRITTQLTATASGFEQWSDVFDGESEDWFALHENMAVQITRALGLHLSPAEDDAIRAHYTENSEAYAEFWQGWLLLESFHADIRYPQDKIYAAEQHLRRALELDPDYPLAVAGMSLVNSYMHFYGVEVTEERRQQALKLANRALELDPHLAEGFIARGMAVQEYGDNAAASAEFRQAVRYDPGNGVAWCLLAASCLWETPPDPGAAEEAARESIRADATWTYAYQMLGHALMLQDRVTEAAEAYEQGAKFNPEYTDLKIHLGDAQMVLKRYEEALDTFSEAQRIKPSPGASVRQAAAAAMLGNVEQAIAFLEEGLDAGYGDVGAIRLNRYLESLHSDPRFKALLDTAN
jgi:TolB-like protein/Tfp pilus assembly protein PilF